MYNRTKNGDLWTPVLLKLSLEDFQPKESHKATITAISRNNAENLNIESVRLTFLKKISMPSSIKSL